jgi:hypothetical protein
MIKPIANAVKAAKNVQQQCLYKANSFVKIGIKSAIFSTGV